ncbi:hypothetical protein THII_3731 [Thioploca ingrica]|uniref:Uncharacterized protein n=1 Tax=Thioploca ingrica TaxID=40754 RepID=A0A090AI22_9GAMM|nr:hypothetical protein THII_3731 [Thioploca ingrica]
MRYKAQLEIEKEKRAFNERYELVKTINRNLERVKNAYKTLRDTGHMPSDILVVRNETLLLSETDMDLQLHQALLTEKFHDLLKKRYELVRHIWDKNKDWDTFIKEWDLLNENIQKEMKTTFFRLG